jgi:purine-binding chemotaxis protein CheW
MKPDGPRRPAGTIDWQDVRRRLDRLAAVAEGAAGLAPERARAVLEERARALARVPPQGPDASEVLMVVTFRLANEVYAVEARHVREVMRPGEHTPVPGAPDFLVGVVNLRGDILAVFDLRKFFGLPPGSVTEAARILVLGGDRAEFGVLADEAHEVRPLRTADLLDAPASVAGVGREYLRGVTEDALVVLDGDVLLRDGRLFIEWREGPGG